MSSLTRTLKKTVPYVFYAFVAVFLVYFLLTADYSKLSEIEFNWWYFALATIAGLAYRYWGSFTWQQILRRLGAKAAFSRELIYVYAKSWLGRYIPGTAPWILGKIYFASKLGISKNKLAVSSLLEGMLQIIITLLISFIILLIDSRADQFIDSNLRVAIVISIVIGCVALVPMFFNKVIAAIYKIIKKKVFAEEHYVTSGAVINGTLLYIVGAIIGGISFLLIAKSIYAPLGWSDALYILGVSNLANAISMLAIFAPSGIGVREGIQIALLSIVMPPEIAAVIALTTRLWGVLIDFLFFGLTKFMNRGATTTARELSEKS